MNYPRRVSLRLVRCISLCLCAAVVLTSLLIAPISEASKSRPTLKRTARVQNGGQSDDRKAQKVTPAPPQPGPPFPNLPNLDEVRRRPPEIPRAPLSVQSTLRSRRKPLRAGSVNPSSSPRPRQATLKTSASDREPLSDDRRGSSTGDVVGRLHHSRITRSPAAYSTSFAPPVPIAPTNLAVSATSSTHIKLSWTASSGPVDHYKIERGVSLAGPFTPIANAATTTFDDTSVATPHSYLYRVRAIDVQGGQSGPSNLVFGTAITFLDEQLVAGETLIKAQHVYDLRSAVNAVRGLVPGMNAATWTHNDLYQALIYREDVQELRDQLNKALAALSVPISPYEDPVLVSQQTLVKKIHFDQLRGRSRAGVLSSSSQAHAESSLARLDPFNQTGDQLRARDCEWSVNLLSLPGRAGLDLGLSLSYSSLVWTRAGSTLYFDEDYGSPSPGFRLGFPTIQDPFFDSQANVNARLLITSSGQRVELRQVGASNIYEAADSSYLQLIDYGSSLLVRTTDGTQMSYGKFGPDWTCFQIEDRNGNLIIANYNGYGDLTDVTDTLGRTITFNYDVNANISTIKQTWVGQSQPHTLISFGWGTQTMQPSFSLPVVGTYYNENIPVLTQVGFDDGSRYNFGYNGVGQVNLVQHYSFDSTVPNNYRLRSTTSYNYESPSSDCPRISAAHVSADQWTGINNLPNEAITYFSDLQNGWHQMIAPDGTTYKNSYGSGWQNGLVTQSEVWGKDDPANPSSQFVKQKWTTMEWHQDTETVGYQTNPRVTETNVYDSSGNRRRTKVTYTSFTLPSDVYEYDANGSTVLRRTHTDYNLIGTYTDMRIIGLPSAKYVCNGSQGEVEWNNISASSILSKVTFQYDESGSVEYQGAPTQHDSAFDSTTLPGRANLSSTRRYDVTPGSSASGTSSLKYNTAGSLISTIDPSTHTITFSYTDSFSADGINPTYPSVNTMAYPTTITDADRFSTTVRYHYDFGARTRTQGPPPQNQSQGAIQTFSYDDAARLLRVTTVNDNAYTRYDYGPYYVQSWSTVNSVADEGYNLQLFDGMGRVIGMTQDHPGSSGTRKGQVIVYDIMGRVMKQSNPTEMTPSWQAFGDDSAGWYYTQQTYDWKGRPLVTTNTDGTTKSPSYTGCGCAGGEMITLTDEGTIDGGVAKKRQQRIYHDVLGRAVKTEVLNWENGSVYATTVNTYNARNQITNVRQWTGAENGGGAFQDTIMTYDGYGRLQTKHVPEQQDSNGNATHTMWAYNPDDTVLTITDARGASATYGYNGRHQMTSVSHALSGYDTINVTYGYDAAGNRTSMNHLIGGAAKDSATYNYDQLSRLTSETRFINALTGSSTGGYYTIGYGYTISGELQSVTDPFSSTTNFSYDVAGRTASVTGSYGGTNYTYASSVGYRAWGAVKAANFGDGDVESVPQFDTRMQPTQFRLTNGANNVMRYDYSYFNDGKLRQLTDLDDRVGDPQVVQFHYMSRVYQYDQSARIAGVSAINPNPNNVPAPFTGNYGYDAFNNLTSRSGHYALNTEQSDTATYTNDRRVQTGWNYDADGRVVTSADTSDAAGSSTRTWTYDAAGEEISVADTKSGATTTDTMAYDGDGQLIYESVANQSTTTTDYLIHSTVLGSGLTKLDAAGNKDTTYVPANGLVMPLQQKDYQGNPTMSWVHRDALGVQENGRAYDPFGNLIFNVQPPNIGPPPHTAIYGPSYYGATGSNFADGNMFSVGCTMDGVPSSCATVLRALQNGMGTLNSISTTGTSADLFNAGLGGLAMPVVNSTTRWVKAPPPKNLGPPTLKTGGNNPVSSYYDPFSPDNEGAPGHWETSIEINFFLGVFGADPQDTGQGLNPVEGEKRWNDCMNRYLPEAYPGGRNKPTGQAVGAANLASGESTNESALLLAIIAKESGFSPAPTGDHGPMELTSWISNYAKNHKLDIVVAGSYDPFPRVGKNRNRTFTGDYDANVQTGENWIRYQRDSLKMSDWQIAYGYGPGPTTAIRTAYANEAISLRDRYAPFVNCLKTGQ